MNLSFAQMATRANILELTSQLFWTEVIFVTEKQLAFIKFVSLSNEQINTFKSYTVLDLDGVHLLLLTHCLKISF